MKTIDLLHTIKYLTLWQDVVTHDQFVWEQFTGFEKQDSLMDTYDPMWAYNTSIKNILGINDDWFYLLSPKVSTCDFVIDTKKLFDSVVHDQSDTTQNYQEFVQKTYDMLKWHISCILQWIFINVTLSDTSDVINKLSHTYGKHTPYPQKIILEYSSPNVAKQMWTHHLRWMIVGHILSKCYEFVWHTVYRRNYLWDRWTPFGKVVYSMIRTLESNPWFFNDLESEPAKYFAVLYTQYASYDDPQKDARAQYYFSLLEQWYQPIIDLWTIVRKLSRADLQQIYELFDIHFDCVIGESSTQSIDVLTDLRSAKLLESSQWAQVVYTHPDHAVLITKSDGGTLYATRDLALCKMRWQLCDKIIIVAWQEQKNHFDDVRYISEKLWYIQPWQLEIVWHGLLLTWGQKMATRSWKIMRMADLISTVSDYLAQTNTDNIPQLTRSALMFNDIKWDIAKDINFDLESMTKYTWDTWIYLQYTSVRLRHLLSKIAQPWIYTESISEHAINVHLMRFPQTIQRVLATNKPHHLAQYTLSLCRMINQRYDHAPKIIDCDDHEQKRIAHWLTSLDIVLQSCLHLLHLPHITSL